MNIRTNRTKQHHELNVCLIPVKDRKLARQATGCLPQSYSATLLLRPTLSRPFRAPGSSCSIRGSVRVDLGLGRSRGLPRQQAAIRLTLPECGVPFRFALTKTDPFCYGSGFPFPFDPFDLPRLDLWVSLDTSRDW